MLPGGHTAAATRMGDNTMCQATVLAGSRDDIIRQVNSLTKSGGNQAKFESHRSYKPEGVTQGRLIFRIGKLNAQDKAWTMFDFDGMHIDTVRQHAQFVGVSMNATSPHIGQSRPFEITTMGQANPINTGRLEIYQFDTVYGRFPTTSDEISKLVRSSSGTQEPTGPITLILENEENFVAHLERAGFKNGTAFEHPSLFHKDGKYTTTSEILERHRIGVADGAGHSGFPFLLRLN